MSDDELRARVERNMQRFNIPKGSGLASRPSLLQQMAHLESGTCGCHDSWDQCPCAEAGHPKDESCGCCPLGTGLCGPKPETRAG